MFGVAKLTTHTLGLHISPHIMPSQPATKWPASHNTAMNRRERRVRVGIYAIGASVVIVYRMYHSTPSNGNMKRLSGKGSPNPHVNCA